MVRKPGVWDPRCTAFRALFGGMAKLWLECVEKTARLRVYFSSASLRLRTEKVEAARPQLAINGDSSSRSTWQPCNKTKRNRLGTGHLVSRLFIGPACFPFLSVSRSRSVDCLRALPLSRILRSAVV